MRRHLDHVYSAGLRRVNGERALAAVPENTAPMDLVSLIGAAAEEWKGGPEGIAQLRRQDEQGIDAPFTHGWRRFAVGRGTRFAEIG